MNLEFLTCGGATTGATQAKLMTRDILLTYAACHSCYSTNTPLSQICFRTVAMLGICPKCKGQEALGRAKVSAGLDIRSGGVGGGVKALNGGVKISDTVVIICLRSRMCGLALAP